MSDRACKICEFFVKIDTSDEECDGICCRFPPTRMGIDDSSLYPELMIDDWCGEFQSKDNPKMPTDFDLPIGHLGLSQRTFKALFKANIRSLGDIIKNTPVDLISIYGFGSTSLREIRRTLCDFNLKLKND
jgi:DNA-directed RNA polymerase alpha subunit